MDCFMSCFGIKHFIGRKSRMFSGSFSWNIRELVLPWNHYASPGSSKEKGSSYGKAKWDIIDADDSIHQEQWHEAKIRKTCGIFLITRHENCGPSDQHYPAFFDACNKMVNCKEQLDKGSLRPFNVPQTSTFSQDNSKSPQFENIEAAKLPGVEKKLNPATLDVSPQTENQMGCETTYPTPLNLAAGMFTPGTVYPPKQQNFRMGAIRSQFLYAVPDLSKSTFESSSENEDGQNSQNASQSKEARDEEQLFSPCVIGTVSEEEFSSTLPTRWNGNRIPNSATKYKEDQKVCCHATPFEMRLEKVLSDEKVYYPQRKAVDMKID